PVQSQIVTISASSPFSDTVSSSFNLVVNNTPPTAQFTNLTGSIGIGGSATLAFSGQSDPSPDDTAAGFTYRYDCTGDGTFEVTNSTTQTYACTYATANTYIAKGRIRDKDGGQTDYSTSVTVAHSPSITASAQALTIDEGQTAQATFTITDADGD